MWQRRGIDVREFAEFHRWSSEAYLEEVTRVPECNTYRSRAYIDYASNGPIVTTCERVGDPGGALAGIVCIDEKVPTIEIIRGLRKAALFRFEEIKFSANSGGNCLVVERGDDGSEKPSAEQCKFRGIDRVSVTARQIGSVEYFSARGGEPIDRAWVVPLGVDPDSAIHHAIILWAPSAITRAMTAWSIVTAFLAVATGLTFVVAARNASRREVDEGVQSVLRSLQVGITRTDADDRVIAANDRAEEVFGLSLPKWGVSESEDVVAFEDLIEPVIVEQLAEDELVPGRYSDVIPRKRRAGMTSSYFARSLATGAWVQCIGGPQFYVEGDTTRVEGAPSTFGVSWRVPDGERLGRIERAYRSAASSRWLYNANDGMSGRLIPINELAWETFRDIRSELALLTVSDVLEEGTAVMPWRPGETPAEAFLPLQSVLSGSPSTFYCRVRNGRGWCEVSVESPKGEARTLLTIFVLSSKSSMFLSLQSHVPDELI